jgi:hypothetical protein
LNPSFISVSFCALLEDLTVHKSVLPYINQSSAAGKSRVFK